VAGELFEPQETATENRSSTNTKRVLILILRTRIVREGTLFLRIEVRYNGYILERAEEK
jgi:hypothetical protein